MPAERPLTRCYAAAAAAIDDVGNARLIAAIDAVAMVRFIADTTPGVGALFPRNPGNALAKRLGISSAAIFQGTIGGNTPQYLVNHFAGKLARGEHGVVLLAGAELLATLFRVLRSGENISAWAGEPQPEPPTIGHERDGHTALELAHGLYEPINTYPLFENSLRHHRGVSSEQHTAYIAQLCSAMSAVAANNPYAWRPQFQTAQDIATVAQNNRYIGYPYTRAMNPILEVDMAAAVIMTTAGKARELGIDRSAGSTCAAAPMLTTSGMSANGQSCTARQRSMRRGSRCQRRPVSRWMRFPISTSTAAFPAPCRSPATRSDCRRWMHAA